jgi:hypothetical protein
MGVAAVAALIFALTLSCGCARHNMSDDLLTRQSYGFLRNHAAKKTEIREILNPDGTVKETITTITEVKTESTTSDILLGANELLGTAVDGASKVK